MKSMCSTRLLDANEMDSVADTAQIGKVRQKRTPGPYKGVRMRRWGRWVSEIRVPNSQMRIWLGSYDTPEKAARAYDAALFCLRGAKGSEQFNFPTEKRPEVPDESLADLSMKEIKEIAAKFAFLDCGSTSSRVSTSVTTATTLPDVLITNETAITTLADVPVMNKRANACKGGDSIVAGNAPFPPLSPLLLLPTLPDDETMLPEILLWEDPIMYDPGPLMGFNKYFADIM